MSEYLDRFINILHINDPEYNKIMSQGWDEISNVMEWAKTLTVKEKENLFKEIEYLLLQPERKLRRFLRKYDRPEWTNENLSRLKEPQSDLLWAMINIEGFSDWEFLVKYLATLSYKRNLRTYDSTIIAIGMFAPTSVVPQLKQRLMDFFKFAKKRKILNLGEVGEVMVSLSSAIGEILGPKALSHLKDCIKIDKECSYPHSPDIALCLLYGINDSKKLDMGVFEKEFKKRFSELDEEEKQQFWVPFKMHYTYIINLGEDMARVIGGEEFVKVIKKSEAEENDQDNDLL